MSSDPAEIALCAAWHAQRFAAPLRTVDGRTLEVVHRGTWSNGFGPDFRDALLVFDGRELRAGSIEVHLRTSGWARHGHDRDARYDDVVLHVVLRHDGAETRRADGALVPVAELGPLLPAAVPAGDHGVDWTRFGAGPCAPDLARRNPTAVRDILTRLGDARLAAKSARLEARLTLEPPGEVLYQELWDGLGYSANREPMRELARALPLAAVDDVLATVPVEDRIDLSRGLLFGVAGFLPLSPGDAALARLDAAEVASAEARWASHGGAWHGGALTPTRWTRARVRPANHPVARLAAGAALLAGAPGGLTGAILGAVRAGTDVVRLLRDLSGTAGAPAIGGDRAAGMVANSVLPFALALAEQAGDVMLSEAAAAAWERLPAGEGNATARRALLQAAGAARLPRLGARGQQGLLQLDAAFCAPRRCFECPIAAAVVVDENDATVHHQT